MQVVISGANRGIGLELVRQLLAEKHSVIAGVRDPKACRELNSLAHDYAGALCLYRLDIADRSSINNFAQLIGPEKAVDLLINNAGVFHQDPKDVEKLDWKTLETTFRVNTLGAVGMVSALLPNLRRSRSPLICNMSSKMGSLTDNTSGGYYSYRISKAALNMFTRSLAIDLPDVTTVTLHPGWVQTDMGGSNAPTTPSESAKGLVSVIRSLSKKDSGRFLDFKGREIPW